MGNGAGKLGRCFAGAGEISRRHDIAVVMSDPLDEGLGHSFCYIRPDPSRLSASKPDDDNNNNNNSNNPETTTFRAISGAYVSANTFTPLSTSLIDMYPYSSAFERAASFESSTLFASIPLQPVPRLSFQGVPGSGAMERGFLSGPIERGFASGPIDRGCYSGPIEKKKLCDNDDDDKVDMMSFSQGQFEVSTKPKRKSLIKILKRAISGTISRGHKSIVAPIKGVVSVKESDSEKNIKNAAVSSTNMSSHVSSNDDDDGDYSLKSQNLQWAQGKAGEDRVHIVISEEHGWVFVGIYDGFNGPDGPDYLLSNLYTAVHKELKGLLWNEKFESNTNSGLDSSNPEELACSLEGIEQTQTNKPTVDEVDEENSVLGNGEDTDSDTNLKSKKQGKCRRRTNRSKVQAKKWEESQRRWKWKWNRERLELDRKLKENFNRPGPNGASGINHSDVLRALSQALRKTEDAYLDIADMMVMENPELALMGSCVLVMLMKGEDVYLMNVGDSRAVLARKAEPDLGIGTECRVLNPINEETLQELELSNVDDNEYELSNLTSLQLTMDHSTYVEEVTLLNILIDSNEHWDCSCFDSSVSNGLLLELT